VGPETAMWVASPRTVAANLLRAFNLESEKLGNLRSLNLPGVVVTVSEMLAALKAQAGEKVASRVSFVSDARIEAIVATWAAHFDTARALSLGFEAGPQMDGIVREYIADEGIKV
jgi:D-erythronate 2-dehydrogenase